MLPSDVELCLVQLPGRDGRFRETPFTQMTDLIPALLDGIEPFLDRPFAFYGHSLGALISFEVARALNASGMAGPVHLFAAAHRAPHTPNPHPAMRHLADGPFIEEIRRRYGGIPQPVLDNPELLELMLPCLRADFTLFETYEYKAAPPLSCPIHAFGGRQDDYVRLDALEPWSAQTTGAFAVRIFHGDHFFLQSSRDALLDQIVGALAPVPRSAPVRTT